MLVPIARRQTLHLHMGLLICCRHAASRHIDLFAAPTLAGHGGDSVFEFKRDNQFTASPCVRCGSGRTVAGTMLAEGEVRFLPRGLRWWKFSGGTSLVPVSVQACLDCGCLVGAVDPAQLQRTIERAGGDELRATFERR